MKTVNVSRSAVSILKVIDPGTSQSQLCCTAFGSIPARSLLQPNDQLDFTENRALQGKLSDAIWGKCRIFGSWKEEPYLRVSFFILSCLIFASSVARGIPSLVAAPFGPATFPLLSARALSISSFS